MKKILIIAGLITVLVISSTSSHAWLIYQKPAFKGKVIDTVTKQPIVGAVVVASYQKTLVAGFEPMTTTFDIREAVTGKDGIFQIPSYTTLINPLCVSSFVSFIIYKPGYGHQVVPQGNSHIDLEVYLSESIGAVVELPKLKTREDRKSNIPSLPSELKLLDKQRNLIRLINDEEESLGLQKSDPYKARDFILNMGR